MENEEFRTVRVYTKKYSSKDKDGNSVEKESKQKQVSLKKEDPFEDNDLVKVIPKEEYEKLINNSSGVDEELLAKKDAKIAELEGQLDTLKSSFFDDVGSLKDQLSDKEELVKAKDEIYELNKKLFSRNLIIKIK